MDKQEILDLLDQEIEFAKGMGIPQFVLGLQQAKLVIEREYVTKEVE